MTELSQEDIDALLTALSAGETPAEEVTAAPKQDKRKKVKTYDFRRPDKFSKDQIRTLQMMHETFARLITTTLSAQLRVLVHVHVASVDQLTYEEFIRSVPSPTTMAIINMDPLKGSAVLEVDPSVTFTIIDRLFGGKGESIKINRELTDIEMAVIEGIIVKMLASLREAWANVIDLRPRLGNIETNPQFTQIVPPNDMVVLVSFDTKVGDVEGMMNLCIPYITIEPIISKLSAQYWYSSIRKGSTTENLALIKERLESVHLEVIVELGSAELSLSDITSLKEGDIIRLNTPIKSNILIKIEGRPKYWARPGIVGKKLAAQIVGLVEEVPQNLVEEILSREEENE